MRPPPVRFVTTPDGVRLAYAVFGNGPPLVWTAHWLTHLEYAWESPVWRHMVEFFSSHFTVVRYDQRGTGCRTTRTRASISIRGLTISASSSTRSASSGSTFSGSRRAAR